MKTNKYIAIAALQVMILSQSACAQVQIQEQTKMQTQPIVTPQAKQSIKLKDGEYYVIERVQYNANNTMLQLKGVKSGLYLYRQPVIDIELKKSKNIKSFLSQYPDLTLLSEDDSLISVRVHPDKLIHMWQMLSEESAVLKKELKRHKPQPKLR